MVAGLLSSRATPRVARGLQTRARNSSWLPALGQAEVVVVAEVALLVLIVVVAAVVVAVVVQR